MKTADHPTLPYTITLDDRHVYRDSEVSVYCSGTSFVKRFFTPFDAAHHASRIASRSGSDPRDVSAAWAAKGKATADWGTLVHAHAEQVVNGLPVAPARNDRERAAFAAVDNAIAALSATYDFIGAELIVFDPLYLLAGTIDLLARNRDTGGLAIFDWKTYEKLSDDAYGKTGLPPIAHVKDSKIQHVRLQLALYDVLLRCASAPPAPATELALLHIPPGASDAAYVILDDAEAEIEAMIEAWWTAEAGKVGRKERIAAMVDPLLVARAGSLSPSPFNRSAPSVAVEAGPEPDSDEAAAPGAAGMVVVTPRIGNGNALSAPSVPRPTPETDLFGGIFQKSRDSGLVPF